MIIRRWLALVLLLGARNAPVMAMSETNVPDEPSVGRTLTLATGNDLGIYYTFGQTISNVAARDGLSVQVLVTKGSVENLERLVAGQVDLCLAQSDVAYDCFHGLGHFDKPATNLIAIAPLYTEAVHILVRSHLQLKRIQDVSGKRVALGPPGSGTEVVARRLLDAAGISISEIQAVHMDLAASLLALGQDQVDVVFVTSGYPSEAVASVLRSGDAWLYEPNIDVCERLVAEAPYFVMSTIPRLTYPGQYDDVDTIGIRALLLGRSDSGERVSHAIAKAVAASRRDNSGRFNLPKDDAGWEMETVVPLGTGAVDYYEETGLVRRLAMKKWIGWGFGVLLMAGVILLLVRFRDIRRRARSDGAAIGIAACFLLTVWAVGSFVLYYAEHKINDSYGTVFLSFWATLINWMNFGTKEPYTLVGRITATVMLVLGAGGVFWFGKNVWRGIKRMKTKYSDHYVIVNWSPKGPTLLRQLRNDDFSKKRDIVVILKVSTDDGQTFFDGEGVTYIKAGGVNEEALTSACVKDAHSVIILADETGEAEAADAKTILVILAVRQLRGQDGHPVPIVAEIRDPEKVNLANYVGVLGNGSVEVVSSEYLGANLLCQAAVSPGVTHVYEDLLTFGKDTNEIYAMKILGELVGRSFSDICRCASAGRGKEVAVIPIGIRRANDTYLNPQDKELGPLEAGDTLFAICDNVAALEGLMKDAARVE